VRRTRTIPILVAASSTSRGSASGDADTDDVRIVDFAFVPRTVRAKVGQKVKWEHQPDMRGRVKVSG
jgi:plastocyanin